jgi:hypothetical protein
MRCGAAAEIPLTPTHQAHKGRFFSDMTLTLAPVSLSHRERGEKPTPQSPHQGGGHREGIRANTIPTLVSPHRGEGINVFTVAL